MTAESGAIDMARVLLDAGADPNIYYDKCDGAGRSFASSRRSL
jgi:hypothetical protein